MSKYEGTFSGTHRPARRDTMYRSTREARNESGFDQGSAPGCAVLVIALTASTAVLAVLGHGAGVLGV